MPGDPNIAGGTGSCQLGEESTTKREHKQAARCQAPQSMPHRRGTSARGSRSDGCRLLKRIVALATTSAMKSEFTL